jgi:Holliday junction resolvase-like predicted endonuclease
VAYAQSKGAQGEREWAEWLYRQGLTQKLAQRNLEQRRKGGLDIIPKDHPFAYEVKRVQNITTGTFDKWWVKVQTDAKKIGREPVVAYRTSRSDWFCMVGVEKLLGVPGSYAIIKGVTFIKFAQKRIIGYNT